MGLLEYPLIQRAQECELRNGIAEVANSSRSPEFSPFLVHFCEFCFKSQKEKLFFWSLYPDEKGSKDAI